MTIGLPESGHANLALVRWQLAGHSGYLDVARKPAAQLFRYIFGGWYEAAEHYRVISIADKFRDEIRSLLYLCITLAPQSIRFSSHVEQSPSYRTFVGVVVAAWRDVNGRVVFALCLVQNEPRPK